MAEDVDDLIEDFEVEDDGPEGCKDCGADFEDAGRWDYPHGELCYLCGARIAGCAHPDLTLDSKISDYCREESSDESEDAAREYWVDSLNSVGAEWSDHSSSSGAEIQWTMTVRQAFILKLWGDWFPDESGFYASDGDVFSDLALGLGEEFDDEHDWVVKTMREMWQTFRTRQRVFLSSGPGRPQVEVHHWPNGGSTAYEILIINVPVAVTSPEFVAMVAGALEMNHAGPLMDWLEETTSGAARRGEKK